MAASEFPQHERLTRVLNIYRRAMRRHIAEQWRGKHADEWFERLYERLTEHQQEEIRSTRETLEWLRVEGEATLSQDAENEFLLDISMFLEAIKSRSDLFGRQLTSRETTDKIYAVYQLRNKWAHPPLRDLHKPEVDGAVSYCWSILSIFDSAAAAAVQEVTGDDAPSSPPDLLLERIEELQEAIDARSLPSDQLQGMLGQLLESTSQMVEQDEGEQEWAKVAAELRALREELAAAQARPEAERAADELAAEIRALRAEIAGSRTWVGEWWARCEREISAWLDRLAGRR